MKMSALFIFYTVFTLVHDSLILCKHAFCHSTRDTEYRKSVASNQLKDSDTEPSQPNQKEIHEQTEEADEQEQKIETADVDDGKDKDI